MGWKQENLHQFLIHGVYYGISYPGTGGFIHNAQAVKLSQFGLIVCMSSCRQLIMLLPDGGLGNIG